MGEEKLHLRMMWFCCHHRSQWTKWEVLLASPLCQSNNLSPSCHLSLMPWVLLRQVFFFRVEPPAYFSCVGFCYGVCFLLSGSDDIAISPKPFRKYPCGDMCLLELVNCLCQGCRVASTSTASSREVPCATQTAVFQLFNQYCGHTALRVWQRFTQFLHLPFMVGRGLLFPVLVPSSDTVEESRADGSIPFFILIQFLHIFVQMW